MTNTKPFPISNTWRSVENADNRSNNLDVPVTAIFMQMTEPMTATNNGRFAYVIDNNGEWPAR